MAFHEVRFPANLSFGSVGGPERRTEVVQLSNGFEERNTPWSQSRRRYDAGVSLRSLDDIGALIAFFEARQGQLNGFRWKDWADFKSCPASATPVYQDQLIGIGDGVRADWPEGWVHVRPSNTEPLARIFAEAPTQRGARRLARMAAAVCRGTRKRMET